MNAVCESNCKECKNTDACPFGKKCWIAKYIEVGSNDSFESLKNKIINEFNSLNIDGMPRIAKLYKRIEKKKNLKNILNI